jgi:ribosome biogenesis protein MAK21
MKASMPDLGVDDDMDMDSDEIPSGLDDSDPDDAVDDEDQFSLAEGSDAEDLIPLDEAGIMDYDGTSDAQEPVDEFEEWGGIDAQPTDKAGKRKRGEEGQSNRKKLKSLPIFASYEDYAKIIEDGPEDNV